MKNSARGTGPQPDDLDGDPFAELARLVEEPWTSGPAAGWQQASRDGDLPAPSVSDEDWVRDWEDAGASHEAAWENGPAEGDAHFSVSAASDFDSLDDAFADAFADEIEGDPLREEIPDAPQPAPAFAAPVDPSYSSWIAPRAAGAERRIQAEHPSLIENFGQALESELETALRGLSAPANPRDTTLHHAQSFAPERIQMDEPEELPSLSPSHAIDDFDKLIASELAVMRVHSDAAVTRRGHAVPAPGTETVYPAHAAAFEAEPVDDGFDSGFDDAAPPAPDGRFAALPAARRASLLGRRSVAFGGGVMALALVGAFVWGGSETGGMAASEDVLLVKADTDPVKVVPENPGGKDIPNQNKAVYERVQSAAAAAPTQEALLTTADEPIDVPDETEFENADPLPGVDLTDGGIGVKEDVRLAEVDDGSPIPVLQPRRVRTVKVRADGTLVMGPEAVPETSMADLRSPEVAMTPAASGPIDLASAVNSDAGTEIASLSDVVGSTRAAAPVPQAAPGNVDVARAYAPVGTQATPAAGAATGAATAAPAASIDPDGYFVQISSQPSEELAKDSLQALSGRYSGLIGSRSIVIQPAEIPGRGTYYRVRVATSSKDEAASLCEQLKLAGGSCFVAR